MIDRAPGWRRWKKVLLETEGGRSFRATRKKFQKKVRGSPKPANSVQLPDRKLSNMMGEGREIEKTGTVSEWDGGNKKGSLI